MSAEDDGCLKKNEGAVAPEFTYCEQLDGLAAGTYKHGYCKFRAQSCLAKSLGSRAFVYKVGKYLESHQRRMRTWVHTFDISSCPPTSHPPYATGNITSTSNFLTKSSRPTRTPAAFRQDSKFISSLIRLTMNLRRDGIAWGSNGGGGFDGSRAGKTSS